MLRHSLRTLSRGYQGNLIASRFIYAIDLSVSFSDGSHWLCIDVSDGIVGKICKS